MSRYNAPHDATLVARWTRWSKWAPYIGGERRVRQLKIGAWVAAEHVQDRSIDKKLGSQTLRYPLHGFPSWTFSERSALKPLYAKR